MRRLDLPRADEGGERFQHRVDRHPPSKLRDQRWPMLLFLMSSARDSYRRFREIQTRWHDNDLYGHVNNVVYYAWFDTVINLWLIEEGGLDIHDDPVIGICAESHCAFRDGFPFPETLEPVPPPRQ